jgi:hypothetical protein
MDEPEMPAERGDDGGRAAPESASAYVVLTTFENSRAAERMVASRVATFATRRARAACPRSWSPATATVRSSSSNPVW